MIIAIPPENGPSLALLSATLLFQADTLFQLYYNPSVSIITRRAVQGARHPEGAVHLQCQAVGTTAAIRYNPNI
jgi:hypothetical protein